MMKVFVTIVLVILATFYGLNSQENDVTLTEVSTDDISGASIWLYAVPDDEGRIAFSAENNGKLLGGFSDEENSEMEPDWQTLVSKNDIDGASIADHWHIFARGSHWIVLSTAEADTAYLLKLDRELNRIALERVVDKVELTDEDRANLNNPEDESTQVIPTNDMFLVEDGDGVTAGFFLPGVGHRLYRFDENLALIETIDIGKNWRHSNGASALQSEDKFIVLAPEHMSMSQEGVASLLTYDSDWNFLSGQVLIEEDGINIGMPSGVFLEDGSLIVHARVHDTSKSSHGGMIVRYIFDPDLTLIETEIVKGTSTNSRAHTNLLGDLLFTTWDAMNQTFLRIDSISTSQ